LYALAALFSLAAPAAADTYTFVGGGTTTNWSDSANWIDGLVPANSPATHVIITALPGNKINSTVDTARNPWILNSLAFDTAGLSFTAFTMRSPLSFQGPNPSITAAISLTLSSITSDSPLTVSTAGAAFTGIITAPQLFLTTGISEITQNATNKLANGLVLAPAGASVALIADSLSVLGTGPIGFDFTTADQSATLFVPNIGNNFKNALVVDAPQTGDGPVVTISSTTPPAVGTPTWVFPSLTVNGNLQLNTPQYATLSLSKVILHGNLQTFHQVSLYNVSGTGSLTANSDLNLESSNNTYTGGTTVAAGGYIWAAPTGALSSGPVAVSPGGTLLLGVRSANADITATPDSPLGGTILYMGNVGANGHRITANTITFGNSVTDVGGDSFTLTTGGTMTGNAALFPLLTRNTNLLLPAGATLLATDAFVPAVQNLGSSADLTFGFTTVSTANATVGAGTPWGTVTQHFGGTLTASSDFTLYAADFSGDIAAPSPVRVLITGQTTFDGLYSRFAGVSQFTIAAGSNLTLGGHLASPLYGVSEPTGPAPAIEVLAGGTLTLSSGSSPSSNMLLHTGAILNLIGDTNGQGGLMGSGTISRDNGPITFMLNGTYALDGPQFTSAFIRAIDTVYLDTSLYLNKISLLNPAATFVVRYRTLQKDVLNLNGGTLAFQTSAANTAEYDGNGVGTVHIGDAGATFLASGDYTQLSSSTTKIGNVHADISATGALTIGTIDPNAAMGHGGVFLSGSNSFLAITVQYAGLGAYRPASLSNAPITLDHAFLSLGQTLTFPPPAYTNTLSVIGESTLDDSHFGEVNPLTSPGKLSVGTINLGAPLHLSVVAGTFHIADLHVTADTSLISQVGGHTINLDILSQDAPHSLSLQGAAGLTKVIFRAAALPAFAGTIDISNATLLLAASQDPSTTVHFDLAPDATLEFAASCDFSSPTGPTLTGSGLVIIDAGATLALPVDSAFAGTIKINGTLFLTAPRDPDSTLTTPAFTLFTAPAPAPAPEPASLSALALAAPLLARRRKRRPSA
jgi:hypothetical protein